VDVDIGRDGNLGAELRHAFFEGFVGTGNIADEADCVGHVEGDIGVPTDWQCLVEFLDNVHRVQQLPAR
jgi:hypothetical protein